jgi:hypothetical protein
MVTPEIDDDTHGRDGDNGRENQNLRLIDTRLNEDIRFFIGRDSHKIPHFCIASAT